MSSGIYLLKCAVTGECYIGTSVHWQKRVAFHIRKLNQGTHKNPKLQKAWSEYGPTAFEFKLLELCPVDKLLERELWWSDKFDSVNKGFNTHTLGSNGHLRHGQTYSRTHKSWESMLQRC